MSNTLTSIIRNINVAFGQIYAETASLPALVDTDFNGIPASKGQNITTPFTPILSAVDRTVDVIPTAGGDQSVATVNVTLTRDKAVKFNLNGDDYLALQNPTPTPGFIPNSVVEAFRVMRNLMHLDLANTAALSATGATGAAATTPFATDLSALLDADQLLNDSLLPSTGRSLIIDTTAKNKVSKLGFLVKANESGSTDMLRRGIIGDLNGFGVTWDNVLARPAVGTGTLYVLDGNHAKGATSIVVKTGTGTIVAGDIVSIAGDPNYYVVNTGIAAPGTFTLNTGIRAPVGGLRQASADGAALTIAAQSSRNIAMHRQAMKLVCRPSAMPPDGDMATESAIIQDPVTKQMMRLAYYKGYGRNQWELQAVWGYAMLRGEGCKIVMGQ